MREKGKGRKREKREREKVNDFQFLTVGFDVSVQV